MIFLREAKYNFIEQIKLLKLIHTYIHTYIYIYTLIILNIYIYIYIIGSAIAPHCPRVAPSLEVMDLGPNHQKV